MGDSSPPGMATDGYYLELAKKNSSFINANDSELKYDQTVPTRGVRHHRLSKQSKLRHIHVLTEKACEEPRRETVTGVNDPLAGPDKEAILSRRQAEAVNNKRTVNGGFFTA